MSVRAPLDPTYAVAAGATVRLAAVYESIEFLLRSPVEYEFRVPWLPNVVEHEEVLSVLRMLSGARRVVLVPAPDGAPGVRALRRVARLAGHNVESCVLAGRARRHSPRMVT
jgi:pyruvate-formate lyase-activating enzyme